MTNRTEIIFNYIKNNIPFQRGRTFHSINEEIDMIINIKPNEIVIIIAVFMNECVRQTIVDITNITPELFRQDFKDINHSEDMYKYFINRSLTYMLTLSSDGRPITINIKNPHTNRALAMMIIRAKMKLKKLVDIRKYELSYIRLLEYPADIVISTRPMGRALMPE